MPKKATSKPKASANDQQALGARSAGAVYQIQDAARIADVSPTTVRVWEQNGLLNIHRGSNGYRYFSEGDLQRVRRIAHLRKVERLNIEGIRRALAESDEDSSAPAPASHEETLGPRLRKLRHSTGLTLAQAGERAELSPSFLSALERDQTGVSAQSVHRLTHAYGATVSSVLRGESSELVQLSSEGKRQRTSVPGYDIWALIDGPSLLQAAIMTVEPGADAGEATSHGGEELLFIMEGVLDVRFGNGQRFKVRPGESLYYPSTLEHEWANNGSTTVRLLWVTSQPTY